MTTNVRVRGIYTTAFTATFLDEDGFDVVQPSDPIRERFDHEFADGVADVAVETTPDRQGIGLAGPPEAVESALDVVAETGLDTLTWPDRAPRGAVFNAVVERTAGGGAIVALSDDREGYLPFDAVDGYVDEGDRLRVQVHDPEPIWGDERPTVLPGRRVFGGVATLVHGRDALVAGTPDGTAEHELVRTTEMLPVDVPDEWAVRWEHAAEGASMDLLNTVLEHAVTRASELDEALDGAPAPEDHAPSRVAAPDCVVWAWFGRDSRFSLDGARRTVTATMTGHHRIKAAHRAASTAVDFVEGVSGSVEEFPFDAVSDAFGPAEDDLVAIGHGKPDGRLITIGRGEVVDCDRETGTVTVRREMSPGGTYDALGVERERGDVATTRFREGRWWYPTVYKSEDGETKGTYINVNTPLELFPDEVRYVDLHVDVVKHSDGTVEVVDRDELAASVEAGNVSDALAEKATGVADRIAEHVGE
ncbi:DUF402 domain-containing protein [Halospeciosus flavus]|uniref:Probable ribonuclease FAU-1 n=1 Tax=Halospeciosus flavus TaxID=3032283 RepID=A0ABD5Z5L3_9EURY|nr:DUF402 domain-containing protein [Halospeciosus flavus]